MTEAEREVFDRLWERVGREEILPIVRESRDELLAEHEAAPFGPHSDELYRVLTYLRRRPPGDRHVIVMTEPHEEWTLARLTRRGEPPELLGARYDTQEAAEHAVFEKRLDAFEERFA